MLRGMFKSRMLLVMSREMSPECGVNACWFRYVLFVLLFRNCYFGMLFWFLEV